MSPGLAIRIEQELEAAAKQLPAAALNHERRKRAVEALATDGLPTTRDENWKYVNLRPLEKVRFAPAAGQPQTPISAADLPPPIAPYARYTFVDGTFAPALSAPTAQGGVAVRSLAASAAPANGQNAATNGATAAADSLRPATDASSTATHLAPSPDLRFALLNDAFATDGAAINVAPGTDCSACIELVFVATTDAKAGASYPRVDLQVGAGARVGLIERHMSVGSDANFINSSVNVALARDASVQHYRVQQIGGRAIWFDTLTATVAGNAKYQLYGVSLGGVSARSTVRIQLMGERAEVALFNAAVGAKNQVHDGFALVEHVAPNARTSQIFRGISADRARVAFNSKIVVRKDARGTDSRQSLRGLLAGSDAEIDVRPQLEIYTDDVTCNHGATAGKLDDNMLFYLLSRGLDRETALRLLKWAFLEDVVAKIEVPELRRQIEQTLAGQLNEAAVFKELA
jgi:Fe-S cluster assembly protein SufD